VVNNPPLPALDFDLDGLVLAADFARRGARFPLLRHAFARVLDCVLRRARTAMADPP
jgi:hypothetical protein